MLLLCLAVILIATSSASAGTGSRPFERPEYLATSARLVHGWGTWNARNVLSQVKIPDSLSVDLAFKQWNWLGYTFLDRALIGRKGEDVEKVRPGLHALDGSYAEMQIEWDHLKVSIETADDQGELVVLVSPLKNDGGDGGPRLPAELIVSAGILWGRSGSIAREGEALAAMTPGGAVKVFVTGKSVDDPYVEQRGPHLVIPLDGPVGISTAKRRSIKDIQSILLRQRQRMEARASAFGDLKDTYLAIESGLAWNTIYEPKYQRMVSTVGRLWDEEYGGYALFGWDNFFLAYMSSLYSRDLAFANFIEHLRSMTEEGFIPNDDRGNGTKSWDHSQPPVGSIMLKEIYKKYPERWLLEASFNDLLTWNRWWIKARKNGELLSYGSDLAKNPYGQQDIHTRTTAGYESGMDDSPMYENVPFNPQKNMLELQDVGLNSLYVADCSALAEIADLIGRKAEAAELRSRAQEIGAAMQSLLWADTKSLFLNRRTDTGERSARISPTMFYPLLARLPSEQGAERMVNEHFSNDSEFHGDFMLPSISRSDPAFPRQRYWKGSVWPPLNFLVYLGLRNYGFPATRKELADVSQKMFLHEWQNKGLVSENYSAITGAGDDPRLSSDAFHSWGGLMGMLSLIEAGKMPAPELPLDSPAAASKH
ncbi:MAG TPA: trehalase family glycosidase [Candidatus Angelobacter sp.]|nr:trehalase family glycosidase [Candidatus Angelobacter sp.]